MKMKFTNDQTVQTNAHPNPLGKPSPLTTEGLALSMQEIRTDIRWIKEAIDKIEIRMDKIEARLGELNNGVSDKAKKIVEEEKEELKEDIEEIKETLEEYDKRLIAVEKHDWMEVGIAAALGSLFGGGVITLLVKILLKI